MMTSGAICGGLKLEICRIQRKHMKTLTSWEVVGGMYSAPPQKVNELFNILYNDLYAIYP